MTSSRTRLSANSALVMSRPRAASTSNGLLRNSGTAGAIETGSDEHQAVGAKTVIEFTDGGGVRPGLQLSPGFFQLPDEAGRAVVRCDVARLAETAEPLR